MSRSKDDDKERYLTQLIVVRQTNEDKGIKEEVVTKKMAKFIDGGPKECLEWTYHFFQLSKLKEWGPKHKFRNTKILLEGDLLDAFNRYAANDGGVRMGDDDFTKALYQASIVVMPVDYSEKIQEDLWEIPKFRSETLADFSKRFRTLVRMEQVMAMLTGQTAMPEDALCRLHKRGLPFEWQSKYDTSGQVYSTVASLVPYFERIEQGELRQHGRNHGHENNKHFRPDNNRGQGRRGGRGHHSNASNRQ